MTNEQRAKALTTEALHEALKMTTNEEIKQVILNELATRQEVTEMTPKHIERAIVKNLNKPVEEINYEFFVLVITLIESNKSLKRLGTLHSSNGSSDDGDR